MIEKSNIKKIEKETESFFEKMTIAVSDIKISETEKHGEENHSETIKDIVYIELESQEPQILIGQGGQTLFEIQRLLRMVLNKKIQKIFFLDLDINGYKKKKNEYLKTLANDLADQASSTKIEKILPPMSSYERRIVHAELSQRQDVITESRGSDYDRCVVIKPK